eukprot:scaffold1761_cov357-Prasinococcus_capsulatus_cf.AAC.14
MGVEKTVLKEGSGRKIALGDTVTVHCTGYGTLGGRAPAASVWGHLPRARLPYSLRLTCTRKNNDLALKFWSTKDPGQKPFTFTVGVGKVQVKESQPRWTMSLTSLMEILRGVEPAVATLTAVDTWP